MLQVNTEATIEKLYRDGLANLISDTLGVLVYNRTELGYIFSIQCKELFLADSKKTEWLFMVFEQPNACGIIDNLKSVQKIETY